MEENYYAILEVDVSSSFEHIKKAYFRLIRKYPVERCPDEFNRIRNAYDTLKDAKMRQEYDSKLLYGQEMESLRSEGLDAYHNHDDFYKASECFKKLLVIEPGLSDIRNFYALSLFYIGEEDKAIRQFQRLIQIEPDDFTYQLNYAKVLEDVGPEEEALQQFKRIYLLFPSNIEALFALVDHHIKRKEFPKALSLLDKEINNEKQEGMHVYYYLKKRIQLSAVLKEKGLLTNTIQLIQEFLKEKPNEKESALSDLLNVGLDLYKQKKYSLALKVFQFLASSKYDFPDIDSLVNETEERAIVYDEYDRLEMEKKVVPSVKQVLTVYLFGDEVSEEEFEQHSQRAFENFTYDVENYPEDTLKSINRIMIKYPALYDCRKELFEHYASECQENLV
ncbi:J domain-containing protein [Neobacillus dielmonensis]|uniref:J domain-containing protein n=1 Tax=Neobacillus dielmonensis TaxID=1347369 RepID=UPI0005A7B4A4|nr:DnaJ domain-containing protein [Neobacillus dielmonensis]